MKTRKLKSACGVLVGVVAALLFTGGARSAAADDGFSFAAYGDSQPMMYFPATDSRTDVTKLFLDLFGLVLPEKVAEEVVKRDVKLIYDPDTKELIRIIMPFATKTEVMTLSMDKGWVTEASVEDVKLLPGVRRTIFRLSEGDWVSREIVKDVQSGRARFVTDGGDVVWWGNQGTTVNESPYWKRIHGYEKKDLPKIESELESSAEHRSRHTQVELVVYVVREAAHEEHRVTPLDEVIANA